MPYKQWYEDLEQIKRRYRQSGTLFEDPEFPAIDSKVFKKRVLPGGQSFEWLRPQVRWQTLFYFLSQYLWFYLVLESVKTLVCHNKFILIGEALLYCSEGSYDFFNTNDICSVTRGAFALNVLLKSRLQILLGIQLAQGFP